MKLENSFLIFFKRFHLEDFILDKILIFSQILMEFRAIEKKEKRLSSVLNYLE